MLVPWRVPENILQPNSAFAMHLSPHPTDANREEDTPLMKLSRVCGLLLGMIPMVGLAENHNKVFWRSACKQYIVM